MEAPWSSETLKNTYEMTRLVKEVKRVTYIRQVSGSNLAVNTDCIDLGFLHIFTPVVI
jgi:hypothetical protein